MASPEAMEAILAISAPPLNQKWSHAKKNYPRGNKSDDIFFLGGGGGGLLYQGMLEHCINENDTRLSINFRCESRIFRKTESLHGTVVKGALSQDFKIQVNGIKRYSIG